MHVHKENTVKKNIVSERMILTYHISAECVYNGLDPAPVYLCINQGHHCHYLIIHSRILFNDPFTTYAAFHRFQRYPLLAENFYIKN